MPKIYPEQLVLETIACFAEEENIALTQEEAIAILDSFGGLFLAFASDGNERGSGQRFSAGGAPRSTGARNTGGTLPIAS
jgi:hypothetical protein